MAVELETITFENEEGDVIYVTREPVPYEDWNEYGYDLYSCNEIRRAWNDKEEMQDWFTSNGYWEVVED